MVFIACEHTAVDADLRVKEFSYSNNSMEVNKGDTLISVAPSFSSSSPTTLTIQTRPNSDGKITIDDLGLLHFSKQLEVNTYKIDVKVSNQSGTNIFTDAYTLKVIDPIAPISFKTDVAPILNLNCTSCHNEIEINNDFRVYSNVKLKIDEILTRIQLASTEPGAMPQNSESLSAKDINTIIQWKNEGLNP